MSSTSVSRGPRAFEVRPEEDVFVPYLRRGQFISLVHWTRCDGEWTYSTVVGEYASRDETYWHLTVRGKATLLPRADWAVFS